MRIPDFVVKYDRWKDTSEDLVDKILYFLYVRQIKGKFPVVTFISGESGHGKSWGALTLMYKLLKLQGIDMRKVNSIVNVHTPMQYPQKLQRLLSPKKFYEDQEEIKLIKATNVFCVHEARNLIKSKKWQDFVSQAVSDVNAMSRAIKRIAFFIVSQFIRDITTDVRYTLNYYGKCRRTVGESTKLYLSVMWKDDRDLEKPKLRKRKIWGRLISPSGKYKNYEPDYFILSKPPKEIRDQFDEEDYEAKGKIIHALMEKMIAKINTEFNMGEKKLEAMVKWYSQDIETLRKIGHMTKRGNWKFKPQVADAHDLTPSEFKEFSIMMNHKMADMTRIDQEE